MRIGSIETRRYAFPLEPPLRVAWDPVPRTEQEATVVIVRSDDGLEAVEVVEAVRDAVGPALEIMVDANQGWRMPGDLEPRWDVATAAQCARALEALGVYWLEEPLRTDDVDGYRALRSRTDLRLAAGGMVPSAPPARGLVVRGGVAAVPPGVVPAGGFSGCPRVAALAPPPGRLWLPHTR